MKAKYEWMLLGGLAAVAGIGYVTIDFDSLDEVEAAEEPQEEAQVSQAPPAATLSYESLSKGLPTKGQWRGNPATADLNGDGHIDIVASIRRWDHSTPGEGVYVWLGDGKGNWTESLEGLRRDMGYGGSAIADIDGDGKLDVAFSGHDRTPHVFLNRDGEWEARNAGIDAAVICSDVTLGDLNGDGLEDLAIMGFYPQDGGLRVYAGDGHGAFGEIALLLDDVNFGSQIEAFDLDADGQKELIATTSVGPLVWRYDADTDDFVLWREGLDQPAIGGSDLGFTCGDLDGDGKLEIIVAGFPYAPEADDDFEAHLGLRIFRWDGEAWALWGSGLPDDEAHFGVAIADLGDGLPTLVTAGKYGICLVRVQPTGECEFLGRLEGTKDKVINIAAGDINGDGVDEIIKVGYDGVEALDVSNMKVLDNDGEVQQ